MGIDEILHKTIIATSLLGALLVSGCESVFTSKNTQMSVLWKDGGIVNGQLIYTNLGDSTDVTPVDIDNKGEANVNLHYGTYQRALVIIRGKKQRTIYTDTITVPSSPKFKTYNSWSVTKDMQLYRLKKNASQDTASLLQAGAYKKPLRIEARPDSSDYNNWRLRNLLANDTLFIPYKRNLDAIRAESQRRIDSIIANRHRLDSLANHGVTNR